MISRIKQYYHLSGPDKKSIPIILIFTILASAFQFLYNRSLWLDEAMLANNIITKDFSGLLQPLDYKQIAPVLFLIIEKLFSIIIPDSELGLRLFPLICFWLTCFYFYKTLLIIFKHKHTIIFALSLLGFNALLIYYSNEVKQYMTDVMVCILIYYILLKDYKELRNKYFSLAIAGCLAVLISNITPLILVTTGIYLCSELKLKDKNQFIDLAIVFSTWVLTFLLYYFFFIYRHPSIAFMQIYWEKAHAFLPLNPFEPAFYQFILHQIIPNLISLFKFNNLIKLLIGIFILTGLVNIIHIRKNKISILLVLPVIIHLILSAFKIYPFDIRLILYIIPVFTILAAFGFDYLIEKISQKSLLKKFLLTGLPVVLFVNLLFHLPMQREELKKSLIFLNKNIKKGDKIYVSYAAESAFHYYQSIHNYTWPDNDIIIGKANWNNNTELYLDDFKNFNGNYWLVLTHINSEEEIKLQDKLSAKGLQSLYHSGSMGSGIYLYQFNDALKHSNDCKKVNIKSLIN